MKIHFSHHFHQMTIPELDIVGRDAITYFFSIHLKIVLTKSFKNMPLISWQITCLPQHLENIPNVFKVIPMAVTYRVINYQSIHSFALSLFWSCSHIKVLYFF